MMKLYYVYNIISPKGKFYVGYTSLKPEKRFKQHIKNSRKKQRKCAAIENAIRYHKPEKMKFIVVRSCLTEQEALHYEGLYTKFFKTTDKNYGYNLREGGIGGAPNEDTREKMRKSSAARLYRTPKGPRVATAEQIEDAIHWVQYMNLGISQRALSMICGDLLGVSATTIYDHIKRISMSFDDARRVATDEQIRDALHWVMDQEFSSMMNKTLVGDLVGNIFGSSWVLLRRYIERHNITRDFPAGKRGPGPSFEHTEEAKEAIRVSKIGTKKSKEELKRRQEKRWENTVITYATIGVDISKDNLDRIITEYPTAYKAAKYLTRQCPEQFVAIRSILRSYLKNSSV